MKNLLETVNDLNSSLNLNVIKFVTFKPISSNQTILSNVLFKNWYDEAKLVRAKFAEVEKGPGCL